MSRSAPFSTPLFDGKLQFLQKYNTSVSSSNQEQLLASLCKPGFITISVTY